MYRFANGKLSEYDGAIPTTWICLSIVANLALLLILGMCATMAPLESSVCISRIY